MRSPNLGNAAFEHIVDAKVSADLLHVRRLALVCDGGSVGDHEAVLYSRQISGEIAGDRVGEIFLLGSLDKFANGRTTIDKRGADSTAEPAAFSTKGDNHHGPPTTIKMPAAAGRQSIGANKAAPLAQLVEVLLVPPPWVTRQQHRR